MATWEQQIGSVKSYPTDAGYPNGQFPADALVAITGQVPGMLCKTAARAWEAMRAAAAVVGVPLSSEGPEGTYRTLGAQMDLLHENYSTKPNGNPSISYGGQTWYRNANGVTVAKPGNSNHGKAVAVDVMNAGYQGLVLNWLEPNAAIFGWQWEVPGESWHLHYTPGDVIPHAVLDYEVVHTPIPKENEMFYAIHAGRVYQVAFGKMIWVSDPHEIVAGVVQVTYNDADFAKAQRAWPEVK